MWKFDITTGWQRTSKAFADSNPKEMGLLLANLIRYERILNLCPVGFRPQLEGLTEEVMGIVSINQMPSSVGNLLRAYLYPDPDPLNRVVICVIIGKDVDRNSDMEYAKHCVTAYQN